MKISAVQSTAKAPWQKLQVAASKAENVDLTITENKKQSFYGFGTCFNELGMQALNALPAAKRAAVLDALFAPAGDLKLRLGRLPVGANDYAKSWYSYDETPGDFALRNFSIHQDEKLILPYVKAALRRAGKLRLFASPWSPPTWMKAPAAYNYGHLKADAQTQETYAAYLVSYLRAYQQAGVPITQLHVQNEPAADQKFPSCVWSGAQLKRFIKDYLGPEMQASGLNTQLWLGTINSADYDEYAGQILRDPQARQYLSGVGYQWDGKAALPLTVQAYPNLHYMQTENECGDGQNTWAYAEYVFDLIQHYLSYGVEAYCYWNAVLLPGGESTWGWQQNSMITADPRSGSAELNPEFYIFKHCSNALQENAKVLAVQGPLSARSLAFENPDGSVLAVLANQQDEADNAVVLVKRTKMQVPLAAHSITSLVFA